MRVIELLCPRHDPVAAKPAKAAVSPFPYGQKSPSFLEMIRGTPSWYSRSALSIHRFPSSIACESAEIRGSSAWRAPISDLD